MPQYIIILLIVVSLIVIFAIILRKFSILARIDINNIESEKQKLVKKRIINDKFRRNLNKVGKQFLKIAGPIFDLINKLFIYIYDKLIIAKKNYAHSNNVDTKPNNQILNKLFAEAHYLTSKEDLTAAENKYIEIIGLDSANIQAFYELGEVYLNKENYQDAEQTFHHVIKLGANNDFDLARVYFYLSSAYLGMSENLQAKESLTKALEIEPGHPKYLNKMINLCILIKDKDSAKKALQKLQSVNPENNKIEEFKQEIAEL